MNSIQTNILEEIKDELTEGEFHARDTLIQTYYNIGKKIIDNNLSSAIVANYIGRSERSVEYMVKFAKLQIVHTLSKEESWTTIVRTRLTEHQKPQEHEHTPILICSTCRIKL